MAYDWQAISQHCEIDSGFDIRGWSAVLEFHVCLVTKGVKRKYNMQHVSDSVSCLHKSTGQTFDM